MAMSQRRAAVAAAHEQRARSLEALGRRSDAIDALRSAVRIHEARLSDAMGLGIPRELLDADDIRPSGSVRGVIELVEQRVNPMFGWARPGAAAEAAAANMRLQLASARLALADVALREEEPRRDEAMEALATEQLARAVGSSSPSPPPPRPRCPSPPPARTRDRRGPPVARAGTTGTAPSPRTSAGAKSRGSRASVAALVPPRARGSKARGGGVGSSDDTQRGDRRRGASPRRCGGVAVRVVRRGRERRGVGCSGQGAAEGAARVRRVRRGVDAMTAASATRLFLIDETRIARSVSYVVYVAYAARGVPSEGARAGTRASRDGPWMPPRARRYVSEGAGGSVGSSRSRPTSDDRRPRRHSHRCRRVPLPVSTPGLVLLSTPPPPPTARSRPVFPPVSAPSARPGRTPP